MYAGVVDQPSENFAAVGRNMGAENAFAVRDGARAPQPRASRPSPTAYLWGFSFRVSGCFKPKHKSRTFPNLNIKSVLLFFRVRDYFLVRLLLDDLRTSDNTIVPR